MKGEDIRDVLRQSAELLEMDDLYAVERNGRLMVGSTDLEDLKEPHEGQRKTQGQQPKGKFVSVLFTHFWHFSL